MITGAILGRGVAGTQGRVTVDYTLVQPAKSAETLAAMAIEGRRWRTTADRYWELVKTGALDANVARRAQFGDEVLATVSENVRQGQMGVILAQATDGRILGASQYIIHDRDGYLNLQATDPEHIPGSPGQGQLRGIGTALLSGVVTQVKDKIDTLYVKPLDTDAALFWSRRGFQVCGRAGLLCVRGAGAIAVLKGGCESQPDCPDGGECLICGLPTDTEAMRAPGRRPVAPSPKAF